MSLGLLAKSYQVSRIDSDYLEATEYLLAKDANIKFVSTQPYIQNLFTPDKKNVGICPKRFEALMTFYGEGHRYLVQDPQAYISWTKGEDRFLPELDGYLGFVLKRIRPVKEYDNFSPIAMERFVFEHSDNLRRSIRFLKDGGKGRFS